MNTENPLTETPPPETSPQKIKIHPLSLGIFWLLEQIDHPFVRKAGPDGATDRLAETTGQDIARAIFIFANPSEAQKAWAQDRSTFDRQAFDLAASITMEELVVIQEEMTGVLLRNGSDLPKPPKARQRLEARPI